MHNLPHEREKLVPLRRFSCDGLYNKAYLSQLVQRGKLKAKKIGRNYCTSREWFEEYLEVHALDETRVEYRKLFLEADKLAKQSEVQIEQAGVRPELPVFKLNKILVKRAVISIMALFILAFGAYFIPLYIDKGDVAGVEEGVSEESQSNATSSPKIIQ